MALYSTVSLSSLISEAESPVSRSAPPEKVLTFPRPAPTPAELDALSWDAVYTGPLELDNSNNASRVHSNSITPVSEQLNPQLEPFMISESGSAFPTVHSWSSPPAT